MLQENLWLNFFCLSLSHRKGWDEISDILGAYASMKNVQQINKYESKTWQKRLIDIKLSFPMTLFKWFVYNLLNDTWKNKKYPVFSYPHP